MLHPTAHSPPAPQIRPADEDALAAATEILRAGGVVAFPTETVYGLGANALSAAAIERIYREKGRPAWNPLIVHAESVERARTLTSDWPAVADALAARFWPGPLTLVLRRSATLPAEVSAGRPTVAVRVPAHPVALRLLAACGLPLAAPSANRSEHISPTTAAHVAASLPGLPLVVDGGPCQYGIESTVVDLTSDPPRLLRPGAVPLRDLRTVLPTLALPDPATTLLVDETAPTSPGQMRRHYAPRVPLSILPSDATTQPGALADLPAPRGLITHIDAPALAAACVAVERLPADAPGYAADLYAALHRLDDPRHHLASIAVLAPPQGHADPDGLWLAIADRLRRAAAPPSPSS